MPLTKRWHSMRPHATQAAYYTSAHRFNAVPSGRRSGKSEIAKRRLVRRAVRGTNFDCPNYFYAAPTHKQAKRIAWTDLKRLVPRSALRAKPSESDLIIPLWHGGGIYVLGMDVPERIEGSPWDGGVLDEYGNMKAEAWTENVRPALSDRDAWCDLIGVPEGRNHYYDIAEEAKADLIANGADSEWGYFHWKSADILDPAEIAAARRGMDLLTFQQEYEGSFVNFEGRAYYPFGDEHKIKLRSLYNPRVPLIVCLDFNIAPGVAVICQEMTLHSLGNLVVTAVIGEVHIEANSNTPAVCRKILTDWGAHIGLVDVYGDATGGAGGSAQLDGSDWDLARKTLRHGDASHHLKGFGTQIAFKLRESNPPERARVNAMNTRLTSADGVRRLFVDPKAAPYVVKDLEGVRVLKGGSGEIDKKATPKLTHLSDALGYYIEYEFPIHDKPTVSFSTARV